MHAPAFRSPYRPRDRSVETLEQPLLAQNLSYIRMGRLSVRIPLRSHGASAAHPWRRRRSIDVPASGPVTDHDADLADHGSDLRDHHAVKRAAARRQSAHETKLGRSTARAAVLASRCVAD